MTIRVEIKNDDQRSNCIIGVRQIPVGACDVPGALERVHTVELKGQDKSVFWVHGGQKIEIVEVQE